MSAPFSTSTNQMTEEQQLAAKGMKLPQMGGKGFLMKKMGGGQFCSPTDNLMSPTTQKLAQSKQRHFTKGKPLSLSSSFQSVAPKGPSKLGNVNNENDNPLA
ncbi:hypothetical protein MNV49_004503 [Pseudohyphozyma bogoriensis]|nr:hypothetical protein MNV49_004503 [Pseudohyphozyma bogoriensis]